MIFLMTLGFAAVSLFDLPRLIKEKYWRELAVYALILVLAFTLAVLQLLNVPVPNPVKDTQYLVQRIFRLLHLTYD